MNSIRGSAALVASLAIMRATVVLACHTASVVAEGNLDNRVAIVALPDINDTYEAQVAAASQVSEVTLYDSVGAAHMLTVAFFLPEAEDSWIVRLLVQPAELAGGGNAALAEVQLTFTESGERGVVPDYDVALGVNVPLLWSSSGQNTNMGIVFPMSSRAEAFSISIRQDGQAGGCPQYGAVDFDGDGQDDLAIFRPSVGIWAILKSSVQQSDFLFKQWGLPGDYPMPGDYSGDGRADLVVWRPKEGNWYICKSDLDFDCTQPAIVQFGLPGDVPLKGDYDGDRILDHAVWRPSNGKFYFRSSFTGQVVERQWGLTGDIPLQRGSDQ